MQIFVYFPLMILTWFKLCQFTVYLPSIYSSIFFHFSWIGLWWQRAQQGTSQPSPSNIFQLLLWGSRGIPRLDEIYIPRKFWVYPGISFQLDMPGRHPGGILASAWATSAGCFQWKGAATLTSPPTEQIPFRPLVSIICSFGHYPALMTIG